MTSFDRRTVVAWFGLFVSILGPSRHFGAAAAVSAPDASSTNAAIHLGAWLSREGITPISLDAVDGGRGRQVADIKTSFSSDALVEVDGFLLPVGFCRYCIAAYSTQATKTSVNDGDRRGRDHHDV